MVRGKEKEYSYMDAGQIIYGDSGKVKTARIPLQKLSLDVNTNFNAPLMGLDSGGGCFAEKGPV